MDAVFAVEGDLSIASQVAWMELYRHGLRHHAAHVNDCKQRVTYFPACMRKLSLRKKP